jgi:Tol biopolymer transport system component
MPKSPLPKLIPALLLVAALLVLPAAANATIAYSTNVFHPHVWVGKNDDGKGAKSIGAGSNAKVSPDGELVIFEREGAKGKGPEMKLYDLATGKTKTIFSPWRESYSFAWSPDSTMVAALRGGELGRRTLAVVDVETGKQKQIASGYFDGLSFSPDSKELAFGLAATGIYPPKSDVYRYPLAGNAAHALTHDQVSGYPLWGPTGQIAFVKWLGAKQRKYGPKNDLFLMNADGKGVKRLTHTKVDPLTQGLYPTAWSASGNQLLAEYGGQDTSYAVAVNPRTGAEKNLSPSNTETGFVGVALTADGKTALGYLGGYEGPGSQLKIASVQYTGGKPKILVSGGFSPSWGG